MEAASTSHTDLDHVSSDYDGFASDSDNTFEPRFQLPLAELSANAPCTPHALLGHVLETSLQDDEEFLDWALISIDQQNQSQVNSITLPTENGSTVITIENITDSDKSDYDIWAITGSSGPVKGRLSAIPYYSKMVGHQTFQKRRVAVLETDPGVYINQISHSTH